MKRQLKRIGQALSMTGLALALTASLAQASDWPDSGLASGPQGAPVLDNASFECSVGYAGQPHIDGLAPAGWTASLIYGNPRLNSTRLQFTGQCGNDGFVERIEAMDSLAFLSEDIETPPLPGKPFDAVVYQQIAATPGTAYSLSAWMVSLCGGSAVPNDCPEGYYIVKMLGFDPTGDTNPLAASVDWIEDRRNFTESRWANLRIGNTAENTVITVYARIHSPFRWHGAHAFVDAFSLVSAPTAHFVNLSGTVNDFETLIRWDGEQSPDIVAIPGGTYQLLFDVQVRRAGEAQWTDWQVGQPAGAATFQIEACAGEQIFEFRLRARSEQPEGSNGAWPNQRYPGDWSRASRVEFLGSPACTPVVFLPPHRALDQAAGRRSLRRRSFRRVNPAVL